MRSNWGKAPLQLEFRGLPSPVPGPGEVIVKSSACGICVPKSRHLDPGPQIIL